jgi:integrase
MTKKSTIFISYRRSDSNAISGRICDRLNDAFGEPHVFKDHKIHPGEDFRGVIKKEEALCNIVLVIIGTDWLNVTEKDNPSLRRLDNQNDWVRFEVETGLQIPDTTVIPVLVNNASMPSPDALRHTFATRYLEANLSDLRGLAALLGHSNLNTVMIYT